MNQHISAVFRWHHTTRDIIMSDDITENCDIIMIDDITQNNRQILVRIG